MGGPSEPIAQPPAADADRFPSTDLEIQALSLSLPHMGYILEVSPLGTAHRLRVPPTRAYTVFTEDAQQPVYIKTSVEPDRIVNPLASPAEVAPIPGGVEYDSADIAGLSYSEALVEQFQKFYMGCPHIQGFVARVVVRHPIMSMFVEESGG